MLESDLTILSVLSLSHHRRCECLIPTDARMSFRYDLPPMPHRICRKCQHRGRLLEVSSSESFVEYYRCDNCGHVWTHEKDNPGGPPKDVTVRDHSYRLGVRVQPRPDDHREHEDPEIQDAE